MEKSLNLVVAIDNSTRMFFFMLNLKKALKMFIDDVIQDYESIQFLLVSDMGVSEQHLDFHSRYLLDYERAFAELRFVKKIDRPKFFNSLHDAIKTAKNNCFVLFFDPFRLDEFERSYLHVIRAIVFVSKEFSKGDFDFVKLDFDKALPADIYTVIKAEYQIYKNG